MGSDTCHQHEPLCPWVAGDTWEFHQPHFRTHTLRCMTMCPWYH